MFCPKCGTQNRDENLWCIMCGNRLDEESAAVNIEVEKIVEEPRQVESGKKEEEKVKDYLVWSILATILASLSFGTVALIFSGLANTELSSGNNEKAKKYSKMARMFCLISLAIGIVKILFIILIFVFFVLASVLPFYVLF